ncbi:TPA: hypothetical protein ACHWKL_002919 [Providencia stuartii]|uniref:Uncharacterized protein n=2 Tax=Providencia stuartii TaxID=588 RepID=A0AAJ1JGF5_PROST|nr:MULTISPECIES: hypothetical protein [Providencia]SST04754.1 Uncharacterised protein [Acinetobacter baumannii]AIN65576.1 hypothetical protein DR96_1543 [Providencia stuartii]EDU58023.1 hypothetical protein PROSTU_04075 [Providencia stuartii ATCC 25827]EMA3642364.1 hypothetical protein [Providencia stuartii]EMD1718358.1 hypothetical protein [Providencia stuartii]
MNHSITNRHSKNSRGISGNEMSTMNNSFAMLMIYHGLTSSEAKSSHEKEVPTFYKATR